MRYSIRARTWVAVTCWRLLNALQLPRDDCCFVGYSTLVVPENVSEAQAVEKDTPAIADSDFPLATYSQQKLIKWTQETARLSGDLKRKRTMEIVPLPAEERQHSGALLFSRYKPHFSADEDAVETMVNRWVRQLDNHCINLDNIPRTEPIWGKTAETPVKGT